MKMCSFFLKLLLFSVNITNYVIMMLIPPKKRFFRTRPRRPIGLGALFYLMLLPFFLVSPTGTRTTYCVVGGWWVVEVVVVLVVGRISYCVFSQAGFLANNCYLQSYDGVFWHMAYLFWICCNV